MESLSQQKITLPSNPFTAHLHLHCLMPPCIVDTTQLAQGQHADGHTTIAVGRYFLVDTKKLLPRVVKEGFDITTAL